MADDRIVTQYSMKPIEEIGLLKMDFLGLRNLDVIEAALDIIEESSGERPDMTNLPLDDAKTYEMLQRGDSVGVFQFESEGMREALKKVRPDEFNDLVALNALYRPGAMRYIDTYARNKRNPDAITYIDERLRSITDSIVRGDPLPGAVDADREGDRRLLGPRGRRPAEGDRQEAARQDGRAAGTASSRARARPAPARRVINELWAVNEAAADYSFNRSHAACYGLISYRTAWLKANYPAEYMAALISSVMSTKDKVPFFVAQCEDMGIEVLPPDVNESGHDFKVVEGNIRFGLDAVKGLGYQAVAGDHPRARGGRAVHVGLGLLPPRGLPGGEQEGERVAREVRRLRLPAGHAHGDDGGAAARAGGRPAGAGGRAQRAVVVLRPRRRRRGNEDAAAHHDPPIMPLPDDRKQLNEWEKETLGLFLSSHPLKEVRPALRARVDCSLADLAAKKDGEWVTVGGMIAECKRIRTRKGDPMMFATLDDLEGQVELLVFNSAYAANAEKVDVDKIVIVRGRVDHKEEGEIKLVAQEVEAFEPTAEEVAAAAELRDAEPIVRRLTIQVDPGVPESFLEDLREVVAPPQGRARAPARRGRAPPAAWTRLARVRRRRLPRRAGRPDRRLPPGRLSHGRGRSTLARCHRSPHPPRTSCTSAASAARSATAWCTRPAASHRGASSSTCTTTRRPAAASWAA